ncbi:MAG: sulfite exporter TauE/SafE family protein [Verrucomicrobia bacterium]|nr:sulfite exporter TauE/SafE family protein [Leptolyngbya sp. ES-bin-22]
MIVVIVVVFTAKPAIAHLGHGALIQSLATRTLTPGLSIFGFGIAFLAGASHALSPGHGKTMVAAYLIGSQGTPRQAILLGLITTITHTFGVFMLGLLTLFASQYVLPEQLYPVLSLISGMTVCGVGFWLLDTGLHTQHSHHHHSHSHSSEPPTKRSLIALGVAGGIVPCPSALVLLLSAIALHQAAYGMLLVSLFSLGLASVLIAIGLTVVHTHQWLSTKQLFRHSTISKRLQRSLPVGSAIAVIAIGAVLTACAVN